jgi:hypothetical protein
LKVVEDSDVFSDEFRRGWMGEERQKVGEKSTEDSDLHVTRDFHFYKCQKSSQRQSNDVTRKQLPAVHSDLVAELNRRSFWIPLTQAAPSEL